MDILGTHLDTQELIALGIVGVTLIIFCFLAVRKLRSKGCCSSDCGCPTVKKGKLVPKKKS
ncbi:hypothetical protein [Ruficoccus sp. ZRK36]|uniref:hypothetical protein n=1 Tax=Ruficoccus sp. ZRK36 TaxID=2866311 RepID=UPI001C73973A|nr:hypothetical protein [Ruficoccus sp. ZRK36]QYY36193.1 hypothetical protein K0V07_01710 [Ruficoccus sp. ZRK36]